MGFSVKLGSATLCLPVCSAHCCPLAPCQHHTLLSSASLSTLDSAALWLPVYKDSAAGRQEPLLWAGRGICPQDPAWLSPSSQELGETTPALRVSKLGGPQQHSLKLLLRTSPAAEGGLPAHRGAPGGGPGLVRVPGALPRPAAPRGRGGQWLLGAPHRQLYVAGGGQY